jgi:DNA repair exonuclease SbcCD ATPase subunit
MVFLQKIPDHLGENVAALKQRMADMEHIQRLLEAQLIKCRKSRTPERAVNNNQLVKIERRIGELRNEEDQYNKYVQLMQEFISKYNQTKQEEQVKIDRLRYEIYDILKKVSSAFELQSQLFDTQEKILTKITNSSQTSKAELREWAKNIEKVANEKDRLIEALVPATLKLQQVPDETNAQLKEAIRELQRIYDKQGTMFGQMPYYPQQYQQSYPQPSELTQVLKNSERESLQKQFERLTDLVLKQQQQAPSAFFQQQQQQQQAPAAVVPANDGVTKAELNDLKSMISNLTRMVLEKPAERKSEPAKWDLPETSSANVRKMQELQRNRDDLLITGRGGDYENQRDVLASILAEEQKKPDPKLAMFEKLLGGKGGGDSSALLDFIIKMKLLKGLGFDISDIFGGTTAISNNTNTNTITGAATQTTDEKFMAKLDEIISILKSPCKDNTMQIAHGVQEATPAHNNHTIDDVYKLIQTIIDNLRNGDHKGANDILENLKKNINTQNNNCNGLDTKLDEINKKLTSVVSGGNISQQVSDMNSKITELTTDIKKLSTDRTSSDTTELKSKVEELSTLIKKSGDIQSELDGYKSELDSIKELIKQLPDCDGLGIIAALKKIKGDMEKLKTPEGTAAPLPSWCKNIKDLVKKLFDFDLEDGDGRSKFTAYLQEIAKFLKDNEIYNLEKLDKFITDINENKKCCGDLEKLRDETQKIETEKNKEIETLNAKITELSRGADEINNLKAEIDRLKAELLTQGEGTNNAKKAEDEIARLEGELAAAKKAEDEIARLEGELAAAKKAEDEIARLEGELAAANAARREEAAEAKRREEEKKEEAAREAARLKKKAEDDARKAEADRKAREAEERKAREAADKARKEAEEKAREAENAKNCKQYLDELLKNYSPMDDRVFDDFKKRYNYIQRYKIDNNKFNKLATAIKEKILNNEIYNDNDFLTNVKELNKNVTNVKCPSDNNTIRKYKELIDQIEDVNDDFENVQGIGKVIVKSRPQITGEQRYKKFLSSDGNKVKINDCGLDIDGEKGPYTAVFIDDRSTNSDIYSRSMGLGSIKGTVETMTKKAYNMLFLSYGLSGSGKTYTLLGDYRSVPGISQLSMGTISSGIKNKKDYKVSCSSVQIYNDQIYDCSPDKNISVYKVTPNLSEQNIPGVKYLPGAEENIIKKLEELRDNWEILTPGTVAYGSFVRDLLRKVQDVFNSTLGEDLIKDILIKIDKPIGQNLLENQTYIKDFIEENGKLEENKSKDKGKINYLINLIKLSKVSNFDFNKENPGYNPINYSKGNIFDSVTQYDINNIDKDSFNEYVKKHVIPNRFTRATLSNPDSSRSHLFIRIKFENKDPNKTFSMYIADLAGSEKPYEYIGDASTEGYFVLLTLKQIQTIMKNYAQHDPSDEKDINNLYATEFENFVKSNRKGATRAELNIAVNNVKIKLREKFPEITTKSGEAIYSITKEILKWDNLEDPDAKINKVITFINVKQFKPDDKEDHFTSTTICDAVNNTLTYGAELVGDIDKLKIRFGRIARRRSYARKSAATLANEGTRAKRRSFKRPKRPSVAPAIGVATNKARKRSYRRIDRAVATSQESGLSKLRRRSIRRVRRKRS